MQVALAMYNLRLEYWGFLWVVVKIMVPLSVPNVVRHLIFRVPPKRDPYFDNHPYGLWLQNCRTSECSGLWCGKDCLDLRVGV